MTMWKDCLLSSSTTSTDDKFEVLCDVRIDAGSIVISYRDEDGVAVYRGRETAPNRFTLACAERDGRADATLIDGERLEGTATDVDGSGPFVIELSSGERLPHPAPSPDVSGSLS
jgi:hypothetical protein